MENCNCHILEIINKILLLQKQEFDDNLIGCDRPFLGPSSPVATYNTRPIILYNKYTYPHIVDKYGYKSELPED